uniref:DDE-1 domain-containing protein n=1 Tax=Trichogramma kaykai TaxID=54128 RepID=A0ABD2WB24_9HYME
MQANSSGKLSAALFSEYLQNILKPYVTDKEFLLLLDSWGGQKNTDLYKIFENNSNSSTCHLKTIPPGCTEFNQPLDVYFHRQIKIFIKELQNSTFLLEQQKQINTREDCLKIHSLIHNQVSAPIFNDMITYAWGYLVHSCPTVALRRGFSNRAQQDLQSVHPRFVPCSGLRALYTGLTCLLHNEKVHDPYELLSRFVGGPETCPDTMDPVEFRGLRTLLSRRVSWNL